MGKKEDKIRLLEEEKIGLQYDVEFLEERLNSVLDKLQKISTSPVTKKPSYAGALSFDFWPITDWWRFSINNWKPGKAFQLTIGPFRLDFWQD